MARTSRIKRQSKQDVCEEAYNSAAEYVFKGGYPNPFGNCAYHDDGTGWGDVPRTIVELRMCQLSAILRDKPEWYNKINDPVIRAKWREETLAAEQTLPPNLDPEWKLTEAMVDYVLDEMEAYTKLRDEATGIQVACYERIWQSDSLIPQDLHDSLLKSVAKLEDVPDEKKDWHPGSEGQVLDLVHPSLYPVRYGHSVSRNAEGSFDVITPPDIEGVGADSEFLSTAFQWLPSDFAIDDDGKAHLQGYYINNIPPSDNADLYPVVEGLVEKAIPMFERVLSDLRRPATKLRMRVENGDEVYHTEAGKVGCVFVDENGRSTGPPYPGRDMDTDDWDDEQYDEFRKKYPKRLPEVDKYAGALDRIQKTVCLGGSTIQVIVKLANIVLTPEKPNYKGGSWHVEGMLNEGIVSTFIYYYDEENITESRLDFRTSVLEPAYHGQDDTMCQHILYDMDRDSPLVQEVGSLKTCQGRCVAFPNIYQHQVQPFGLADPAKPGHRKIVALFLINPDRPVPSTTTVPPQQAEWVNDIVFDEQGMAKKLPLELVDMIAGLAREGTMSREEAESVRAELMKERSLMNEDHTSKKYSIEFNLCEH